ncbi:MAG: TIGR02281 family clan AA aspartic protease [Pseudomonadota bacterium]
MTFVWVILGLIGAIVLYLVLNDENATTFGLQNSEFAQVALLSIWGAVIAAAVIPRRHQWKEAARNFAAWILIILLLCAGYIFRYDLQDIASRMTAGLIPGSPRTIQLEDGRNRIVLSKSDGQHFVARMKINGMDTRFLVDTGATITVLTMGEAERIGIDIASLSFSIPTSTANGIAYAAKARVDTVSVGAIERTDLGILVAQSGALRQNLLGMNFLNTLSSFEFSGDELYLND